MYVMTKKVVIIYLVTIITFTSLVTTAYQGGLNKSGSIAVVTSEELAFYNTFAQNIFSNIDDSGAVDDKDGRLASENIFQIDDESQLEKIVGNYDLNIIFGDQFNASIPALVEINSEHQFVLIENSLDIKADNVYQINIDYEQLYARINDKVNKNNKAMVILVDQFSQLSVNSYIDNNIAANPNIKLLTVDNTSDNVKLKAEIADGLEKGFTTVYALDPYNNQLLIESIDEYNQELITIKQEEKLSEIEEANSESSEANSESSEANSESLEVTSTLTEEELESLPYASLHYLAMNQTDYQTASNYQFIHAYNYNPNEQINSIIESNAEQIYVSGKALIAITSK